MNDNASSMSVETMSQDTISDSGIERTANSNVYVSGLAPSVKDADIKKLFGVHGHIESAKVMLNIHTGKSRGMGFVKFSRVEEAREAIKALDGHVLFGAPMTVRYADQKASYNPGRPTNRIFVRNIPASLSKEEVLQYFTTFGAVSECTIHPDTAAEKEDDKLPLTIMAYLTYQDIATAKAASEGVHGEKPFACCIIPLLAKVAESDEKRAERLRKTHKGGSRTSSAASSPASSNSFQGSSSPSVFSLPVMPAAPVLSGGGPATVILPSTTQLMSGQGSSLVHAPMMPFPPPQPQLPVVPQPGTVVPVQSPTPAVQMQPPHSSVPQPQFQQLQPQLVVPPNGGGGLHPVPMYPPMQVPMPMSTQQPPAPGGLHPGFSPHVQQSGQQPVYVVVPALPS